MTFYNDNRTLPPPESLSSGRNLSWDHKVQIPNIEWHGDLDLPTSGALNLPPTLSMASKPASWLLFQPNTLNIMGKVPVNCPLDIFTSGDFSAKFTLNGDVPYAYYFPRSQKFSVNLPTEPRHMILFTYGNGIPGPYILDLVEGKQQIDAARIPMHPGLGAELNLEIDWPELYLDKCPIKMRKGPGVVISRATFAHQVASLIVKFISTAQQGTTNVPLGPIARGWNMQKSWDIKKIPLTSIRIMGLLYFERLNVWVPVLAFNPNPKQRGLQSYI